MKIKFRFIDMNYYSYCFNYVLDFYYVGLDFFVINLF